MPLNLALREVAEGRLVAHPITPRVMFRTLGICVCEALPSSKLRELISALIGQVVRDMCRSGEWPATRLIDPT